MEYENSYVALLFYRKFYSIGGKNFTKNMPYMFGPITITMFDASDKKMLLGCNTVNYQFVKNITILIRFKILPLYTSTRN